MATAFEASPLMANTEAALRRDLAACFRLCALHGWDDHIATHMSARLPDGSFLLNPFGLLFEEITASNLMRVDLEGNVIAPPGHPMNPAAFTIHSAVLGGRPDVGCVIHLHTRDGAAVSALEEGLLPMTQTPRSRDSRRPRKPTSSPRSKNWRRNMKPPLAAIGSCVWRDRGNS